MCVCCGCGLFVHLFGCSFIYLVVRSFVWLFVHLFGCSVVGGVGGVVLLSVLFGRYIIHFADVSNMVGGVVLLSVLFWRVLAPAY